MNMARPPAAVTRAELEHADTFGERLAIAIRRADTNNAALGAKIGMSGSAVGQTIAGKTKEMSASNAARAAKALKCDLYWLSTGHGDPYPHQGEPTTFDLIIKIVDRVSVIQVKQRARVAELIARAIMSPAYASTLLEQARSDIDTIPAVDSRFP